VDRKQHDGPTRVGKVACSSSGQHGVAAWLAGPAHGGQGHGVARACAGVALACRWVHAPLAWRDRWRRFRDQATMRSLPRDSRRPHVCARQSLEDRTTMDDDDGVRERSSLEMAAVWREEATRRSTTLQEGSCMMRRS
jgi:hypothetical protein